MQVLAARVPGLEASRALVRQRGLVRRAEIRRAPEEPGDILRQRVQRLARGVAAGEALGIRREDGEVAIPPRRQVSPLHLVDLARKLGVRGPVRGEERRPPTAGGCAARTDAGGEVLANAVGDEELCVLRPPVAALGEADLLVTER